MKKSNDLFGLSLKLLILSFIFLFSFGIVAAANTITLVTPAQDASVTDTQLFNATLDTNTLEIVNVSIWYQTPGGSTWIHLDNITNDTADDTVFNKSIDISSLGVDDNDFVFNATGVNSSADVTSDNSTGVDLDNGNPTATLSSATFSTETEVSEDESFTVGIDADSSIGVSSCTVYYTNDATSAVTTQAVSASGNACSTSTTAESQSLGSAESYTVLIEATDGNGDATNSSSRLLRITSSGGGGGGGFVDTDTGGGISDGVSKATNFFDSFISKLSGIWEKIKNIFN